MRRERCVDRDKYLTVASYHDLIGMDTCGVSTDMAQKGFDRRGTITDSAHIGWLWYYRL